MPPVFVGGTGRSGTGIVARLIGAHTSFATIPAEVRFHADPGGLVDLLNGRVELDWFLDAVRRHWYAPERPDGRTPGLRRICPVDTFESALAAFARNFPHGPTEAARTLMSDLLDPVAAEAGKATWVEHTPPNLAMATGLAQIFPEAKFIHCVRNGADVACSVARQAWGPHDRVEALLWWHDRFRDAARGERGVGTSRAHRVDIDRLAWKARQDEFERLVGFLGVPSDPAMRGFFERELTSARVHSARSRQEVPPAERPRFEETERLVSRRLDRARLSPPQGDRHQGSAPVRVRVLAEGHALRWRLWQGRRWRRSAWRRAARRLRNRYRGEPRQPA